MKVKTFEKVDEKVYYEKLDNGLQVFLYPTKKTKNFYITISVKYGGKINKYKVNNKIYDVIPGSAHFLEHKVMALSENKEITKRINELGSLANAWTNYDGTNYNIFGSINLKENLRILLDIFYNTNINEQNVEEEKGIIGEEIDMYNDQISSIMLNHLYANMFHKSYIKNTVIGERSDIEGITAKSLNRIYKHFYIPNNTFIIVTGDFDQNDIMNEIKNYIGSLNLKKQERPKIIKSKEKSNVKVTYEEIKKDTPETRVIYAVKMPKKLFNYKDDVLLRYYITMILSSNFSATSPLYEKYKNEDIVIGMNASSSIVDDYVVISVKTVCNDANLFLENIEKDIKNLKLDEDMFERKKKLFLKSYILDFDNIEDVEYNICSSILLSNKPNYTEYSYINNMNYKEAKRILDLFEFDNVSVIRTIK